MRLRLRRAALPRARRGGPGIVERIGGWRRLPGGDARARGTAGVGAALGLVLLASSTAGWRVLPAIPAGLALGARGGLALADRERRAARARARAALPVTLDRLTTCVLAGLSVEGALRTVAPGAPGVLGEALTRGVRALELGVPRERVYDLIAERADLDDVRAVLAALARAERFGTSVADALVAQAADLRSRARAAAEAEARTAPVKLLFPLVLCFLPAFVLLTIAPIALSAVRTLSAL